MMGRRTSFHPSALWTLPGRSGGQAVAVLVEDEERVMADGLEVAVVRGLLFGPVDRTLRAVDVEGHAPGPGSFALHQLRIEARETLVVPLLSESVRLKGPVRPRGDSAVSVAWVMICCGLDLIVPTSWRRSA